ncbi:Pentatricopeptide repeat-containing protein [Raphanus sativus]|nr:Pentatricopeptide repeat-containing protein [Raphanus sativus]
MRLLTTPHSLNVFLDVLSKSYKVKEELAMLGKINKLGLVPSVVTYTTLVDRLVPSGDVSGSLRMLEAMKLSDDACISKLISMVEQLGRVNTRIIRFRGDTAMQRRKNRWVQRTNPDYAQERKEHSKCVELITFVLGNGFVPSLKKEGETEQARELVMELLSSNEVVEKNRMLDYVKGLMEGEKAGDCGEVIDMIDQLHCKERPIF